jgi:predicted Rossmann-fold nucleotide-binding protein
MLVERYIVQQPSYPFLKAIEHGNVTSQGILLTRFFPSPILKRMLLSEQVSRCLKGIYFRFPSRSHGDFFSNEDRALLNDLHIVGTPVFWVDERSNRVLQYVQKPHRETGMFVPLNQIDAYLRATVFGVYGSNLVVGPFEAQLSDLLKGILALRSSVSHPLLSRDTPLALVTGGGPGAMELANKVAKELGILSCANIADFRLTEGSGVVNEQKQNPYVEGKMTYRLKELVERQAEFNLDFPIFVSGGIGTDFEFCLEEVRRKVGCVTPTPIMLFGEIEYWKEKITHRYQCNLAHGTIKGSEWVSGCCFCIQTAQQGLAVYRRFFDGTLPLGTAARPQPLGFVTDLNTV